MKQNGISQEGLKLLACVTMLIDHIGAALLPQYFFLRCIGRIAFPIFCFLLAEGVHYTHSPQRYGLRLLIAALVSEFPFDFAFHLGPAWHSQNVMYTLLLGFLALLCMKRTNHLLCKVLAAVPFAVLAKFMQTDYGAYGVALIAVFGLTRQSAPWVRCLAVSAALAVIPSANVTIGSLRFSCELFGILAMLPIFLYSGKKRTSSRAVQWAFYLFYPVHLTVLWLIQIV